MALITRVLQDYPKFDCEDVDLTEYPELAARYRIMSVPAVVIDGRLQFTRVPKERDLREKIQAMIEGG